MRVTVYQYPACSTCKKALAWLRERQVEVEIVDIVKAPPDVATLRRISKLSDRPPKKMMNVSGQSYRNGDFKTRLPAMTDDQVFAALAADGKLIKRPLLVAEDFALVGFDPSAWSARFA